MPQGWSHEVTVRFQSKSQATRRIPVDLQLPISAAAPAWLTRCARNRNIGLNVDRILRGLSPQHADGSHDFDAFDGHQRQ
jgi:hypothetical protein